MNIGHKDALLIAARLWGWGVVLFGGSLAIAAFIALTFILADFLGFAGFLLLLSLVFGVLNLDR